MFDGRWRSNFEKGLRPVGGQLRRTGITANHLTTTGLVMAVGASIAIANGALRAGLLLLVLTALPDVLGVPRRQPFGCENDQRALVLDPLDTGRGRQRWHLSPTQRQVRDPADERAGSAFLGEKLAVVP